MTFFLRYRALCCGSLAALLWVGGEFATRSGAVGASPAPTPQWDSDGDLLPDDVERILFTDPNRRDTNGDGISDFDAAIHSIHAQPFLSINESAPSTRTEQAEQPVAPLEHGARVALSIRDGVNGEPMIWAHYLFKFVGAHRPLPTTLSLWVADETGSKVPLSTFVSGQPFEIDSDITPNVGLLLSLIHI